MGRRMKHQAVVLLGDKDEAEEAEIEGSWRLHTLRRPVPYFTFF